MHPMGVELCFWEGVWAWIFQFPVRSQHVPRIPNVYSNMFPIARHFISYQWVAVTVGHNPPVPGSQDLSFRTSINGIWVSGPRRTDRRRSVRENGKLRKRVISTKRRIVLVLAMTVKTGKVPGKLPSVHCPVLPQKMVAGGQLQAGPVLPQKTQAERPITHGLSEFIYKIVHRTFSPQNLCRWANIETYMFFYVWKLLYWEALKVHFLFCDGPIREAHCKKNLNLEDTPTRVSFRQAITAKLSQCVF